jgi:hypothetical protein
MRGRGPGLVCVCLVAVPWAAAQETASNASDPLAPVNSMGKPPRFKPFTGGYFALETSGGKQLVGGGAYLGLYKDLMPSLAGIGVSGEAYAGGVSGLAGANGGVRGLFEWRGLFLKAGVDHDFQRDDTSFLMSLTLPLMRGGLFGYGTNVRVDWLPGRDSWGLGVQVPLEPHMGKTRPRYTEVDMPRAKPLRPGVALPPEVSAAMKQARAAARSITLFSGIFWRDARDDRLKSLERSRAEMRDFKRRLGETGPLRPRGVRPEDEVRIFHDQLALAFGIAAGAPQELARARGEPLAAAAREVMLDEVLLPYNRLYGQYKRPDGLWGLGVTARQRFEARLPSLRASARQDALREVFADYLRLLEETRAWWLEQALRDARLPWLPFQLALLPEQHDTQQELDSILGRAQGTPLVGGNHVFYWNGQQWQRSLHRTIHAAEDYHVLWLHDYDGVDAAGDPDVIGQYISVEGYLQALTARVREFDRTGKLPVYMILVDLNYWEGNKGRLYTDVLQDPLHANPRLPKLGVPENREIQRQTEQALAELRAAVQGSKRLQEEAARRGQDWLRKYVSVHLSVMNPADFSFRTRRLIGYLPITPDTVVRDHRKIVFYDVTEDDPGKGAALYGGVAVGEQYTTSTWEDRAVRLAGPAALTLKAAARRYLEANGVAREDVPQPLRALPKPPDYDARVKALEARGWTATAMEVHNDRGFARKDASIASAVLYTLMPPGSLILVPDSIWTHEVWAGQLVGAALRGCHVYVIAPSAANAPSAGFPQLSRTREIFSRFVEVQSILGPEIAERGGSLRAGLYTRAAGVTDVPAKLAEMHQTFERYPFLKQEFPFPPEFYAKVAFAEQLLGYTPEERLPEDSKPRSPKLHRKTQLFITRDTLAMLARNPAVQQVIARQVGFIAKEGLVFDQDELQKRGVELDALFRPFLDAARELPEDVQQKTVVYMTVGSLNKDARGMMTDGEVLQVTAGPWAIWALADMWMLTGSTAWLEAQEDLDRLLPPYKQWQRRIGRWFRKVI